MKKSIAYIFVVILYISFFSGCIKDMPVESVGRPLQGANLLEAWTGEWTEDKRLQAIEEYREHYEAVVMNGTDGTYVTFEPSFEVVTAKVVCVSRVDDGRDGFEFDKYTDMYIKTECNDNKIVVHTEWWYLGGDATIRYPQWSYLVMVEDANEIPHYYYFRVAYSK